MTQQLSSDERAELELLRDLKQRVVGFGGDDYTVMAWVDAHRLHADEPYIGCPFCRDQFVAKRELLADDFLRLAYFPLGPDDESLVPLAHENMQRALALTGKQKP